LSGATKEKAHRIANPVRESVRAARYPPAALPGDDVPFIGISLGS
jgi:hypothetical protein